MGRMKTPSSGLDWMSEYSYRLARRQLGATAWEGGCHTREIRFAALAIAVGSSVRGASCVCVCVRKCECDLA